MVDRLTVVDLASVINPMAVLAARGFRSEEVEVLLQRYPADFNIERTNALLDNLEARGIDRGQVNGMVVKLPSILSYTAERTNALLEIFDEFTIDYINKPMRLMFAPATIRGRIQIIASKGLYVYRNTSKLFLTRKRFAAWAGLPEI